MRERGGEGGKGEGGREMIQCVPEKCACVRYYNYLVIDDDESLESSLSIV